MKKWYSVSCKKEVGSYEVEGNLTDFPKGVLLVYSNCCLTTGMKTKKEALKAIKKYPCDRRK